MVTSMHSWATGIPHRGTRSACGAVMGGRRAPIRKRHDTRRFFASMNGRVADRLSGARAGILATRFAWSTGAVHMAATLAANFAAMCRVGLPGGSKTDAGSAGGRLAWGRGATGISSAIDLAQTMHDDYELNRRCNHIDHISGKQQQLRRFPTSYFVPRL